MTAPRRIRIRSDPHPARGPEASAIQKRAMQAPGWENLHGLFALVSAGGNRLAGCAEEDCALAGCANLPHLTRANDAAKPSPVGKVAERQRGWMRSRSRALPGMGNASAAMRLHEPAVSKAGGLRSLLGNSLGGMGNAGLPRHPCAGANAAPAPAQGVSPLDPFSLRDSPGVFISRRRRSARPGPCPPFRTGRCGARAGSAGP